MTNTGGCISKQKLLLGGPVHMLGDVPGYWEVQAELPW